MIIQTLVKLFTHYNIQFLFLAIKIMVVIFVQYLFVLAQSVAHWNMKPSYGGYNIFQIFYILMVKFQSNYYSEIS